VATGPLVVQPVTAQPVVMQPAAAQPVTAQPVTAQPVVMQPIAQPVAAQPIAAQPIAAQPISTLPIGTILGSIATQPVLDTATVVAKLTADPIMGRILDAQPVLRTALGITAEEAPASAPSAATR